MKMNDRDRYQIMRERKQTEVKPYRPRNYLRIGVPVVILASLFYLLSQKPADGARRIIRETKYASDCNYDGSLDVAGHIIEECEVADGDTVAVDTIAHIKKPLSGWSKDEVAKLFGEDVKKIDFRRGCD